MKVKNKARFSSQHSRQDVIKKLNPFEVHINRSKHQVLGRKLKSDQGLPGISRSKAIQKRKKTLLQEYKMKDKANHFIDQRIGERNSGMTEDDKIMARFTAERMRMFNKKAMFNLSDSEVLTHRGQTLSEIERFEDTRSDDDEDDPGRGGALKGKFVGEAHFGGGMLTKNKKDRESLIDELINESKKRKAERQRNKEETLEATEQLDEDWKALGQIITSSTASKEPENSQQKDNYDVVMRQFKFEPQGQASQRLKTDVEIAKEDKEKLEKLEKERLKQLREIEATKYGSYRSADDLDDGFGHLTQDFVTDSTTENQDSDESGSEGSDVEMDEENEQDTTGDSSEESEGEESKPTKPATRKQKRSQSSSDPSKEDENDSGTNAVASDSSDQESESESSDEEYAMDDLTDLMPEIKQTPDAQEYDSDDDSEHLDSDDTETSSAVPVRTLEIKNISSKTIKILTDISSSADKISNTSPEHRKIKQLSSSNCKTEPKLEVELDLPYVIKLPETFESFQKLVHDRPAAQLKVIFDRLIKTNHPSLEPSNKMKMYTLAEYIVKLVSEGDVAFNAIPVIVANLRFLKECNREECLKLLLDSLAANLDSFDVERPSVSSIKYLLWYVELFSRPQGLDALLPVNKPALSLMSRVVTVAEPLSPHGATALFCCHLLLQDAKTSTTLYPEAISFLHKCIQTTINIRKNVNLSKSTNKTGNISSKLMLGKLYKELKISLKAEENGVLIESDQVLSCSLVLIAGFVRAYRKYPQSKILFKSLCNTLGTMKARSRVSGAEAVSEVASLLQVLQSARLPPLTKAAKRPKALRQYEPCFHTVTLVGRSVRGLPAERAEELKLQHKYKHALKGAKRELRRDSAFLAKIKLMEKAQSDEQRIKKVKEIFGSAAAQQGELRKLQRKK